MKANRNHQILKKYQVKINVDMSKKKVRIGDLNKTISKKKVELSKNEMRFEKLKNKLTNIHKDNKDLKVQQFNINELSRKICNVKNFTTSILKELKNIESSKNSLISEVLIGEKKIEKINGKINNEINILKEIQNDKQFDELVELKAYEQRNSSETISNPIELSTTQVNEVKGKQEIKEDSNNAINLNKKWINNENEGVELEYQRDDGRRFHFEIEKDENNKINVNLINSDLSNFELNKLKLKTKYSFSQKALS